MKLLKKFLFCLIALTMAFVPAVSTAAVVAGYVLGDADGSGTVEVTDAALAQRVIAGLINDSDGMITRRADVDSNGKLEITDTTIIQRHLADMTIPYPVGTVVGSVPATDPYELPII